MIIKMKREKIFCNGTSGSPSTTYNNISKPFYTKPVKFYTSYWYLSSRVDRVLSKK